MRVYIVEYRHFDKAANKWSSKISQEGYVSLEAAQKFIEGRAGNPVKAGNSQMYYQTAFLDEYYIHDILVRLEAATGITSLAK